MNINQPLNNQNHVVTMKSKPVSSVNIQSTWDSSKQDASRNSVSGSTKITPSNSSHIPVMIHRKPTSDNYTPVHPSHTPTSTYRIPKQMVDDRQNDSLNISTGTISTNGSIASLQDPSVIPHTPALDAIHRLYHDRDQLMTYLHRYHADMEQREQKFRHIFTHLTKTLEKAQSDIHSLQSRESQ